MFIQKLVVHVFKTKIHVNMFAGVVGQQKCPPWHLGVNVCSGYEHNIIQPCGMGKYVNYFMLPPNKTRMSFYYSYLQVDTWRNGWSYTPGTTHMKQCSSQYHSLIYFYTNILTSLRILRFLIIFLLSKPILFIIRTDVNFSLFSKFLPHEGKIVETHAMWYI